LKKVIATNEAPPAIGPYSQGLEAGGSKWILTSGQIPLDPETGTLVAGGVKAQTRQSLENVRAVLRAGGAELEDVVKVTVFITDMSHFSEMNEVYTSFFTGEPPTRSCVAVKALPRDALVEIEAIALK
jgi:2-iminobutanoate/2-iminopropanoate deaminase